MNKPKPAIILQLRKALERVAKEVDRKNYDEAMKQIASRITPHLPVDEYDERGGIILNERQS